MTMQNSEILEHNFNYVLDIEAPYSPDRVGSRIWFLGTGREDCLGQYGYDCIMPDQIQWYLDESNKIGEGDADRSKGIGFFHIPLPEMMFLHNSFPTYGTKQDNCGCSSVNTGFF